MAFLTEEQRTRQALKAPAGRCLVPAEAGGVMRRKTPKKGNGQRRVRGRDRERRSAWLRAVELRCSEHKPADEWSNCEDCVAIVYAAADRRTP